jgi:type IV pilus assembly protein PilW
MNVQRILCCGGQGKSPSNSGQRGFTLIEIMISLLIGAFVLGGVMQLFINTRQTHLVQEELAKLQENARFAMEFISMDIRMADYRECLDIAPLADAIDPDAANTFDGPVSTESPALDTPDAIQVNRSEGPCPPPGGPIPSNPRKYGITPTTPIQPDETRRLYQNTAGLALVDGVENMQILYGIDSDKTNAPVVAAGDGVANFYVTANNIPDTDPANGVRDMDKVVSVRVSLLMHTMDNVASTPLTFTYNGGIYTPPDRRIRRVFTSTVALRNRIQ